MNQQEYLEQRIDDQIKWYGGKSAKNKWWYRLLRVLSVVIALSIPLMTGWLGKGHDDLMKIMIASAGAMAALLEGIQGLFRFHENWIQYRSTAEHVQSLKFLFVTGAAPYSDPQTAFGLFVRDAEEVMSSERGGWAKSEAPKPKTKEEGE